MEIYIALLRGINVSGKNIILKNDLKLLFESLNFKEVKTYIQSGNVIFKTTKNKEFLSQLISNRIKETLNYEVPVIILTKSELQLIINDNPFLKDNDINLKKLYVTYLDEVPSSTQNFLEVDFGDDEFVIKNKIIYIKYNIGAGSTKLSNKIIENKLQVIATSRNWRTTNKLLEIVNS